MKMSLLRLVAIIVLLFAFSGPLLSQSKYVKMHKPMVDSLSEEYGIPSSVILGVAILESGSGTSRNARMLNNHFGIVGKNKATTFKSRYKQYDDVRESFKDFCKLLKKKKYYKNLKGNMNYMPWIESISKAGYSEVPDIWKQRVISTIKKNKLSPSR